jgi:hypothetical protein
MNNTMLNPIAMYGCKACFMIGKENVVFNMQERKVLRKVYGPVTEQGVWRIRTIQELNELYKIVALLRDIKRRRLKWVGHMIRMIKQGWTRTFLKVSQKVEIKWDV